MTREDKIQRVKDWSEKFDSFVIPDNCPNDGWRGTFKENGVRCMVTDRFEGEFFKFDEIPDNILDTIVDEAILIDETSPVEIEELFSQYCDIGSQLVERGIAFLRELLRVAPQEHVELGDDDYVSVNYDGGNHPEYDSNCYSHVEAVYVNGNDGEIYLELEETDEYPIDSLSPEEIYYVTFAVKHSVDKILK